MRDTNKLVFASFTTDTGQIFDNSTNTDIKGDSFCRAKVHPNPSGRLLAVDGCFWACPYEIRFYDLINKSNQWPEVKIENYDQNYCLSCEDDYEVKWLNNEIFEYTNYRKICTKFNKDINDLTSREINQLPDNDEEYDKCFVREMQYRVTLKQIWNIDGSMTMNVVDTEASDYYLKLIAEDKVLNDRIEKYVSDLKSFNEIYLEFKD